MVPKGEKNVLARPKDVDCGCSLTCVVAHICSCARTIRPGLGSSNIKVCYSESDDAMAMAESARLTLMLMLK